MQTQRKSTTRRPAARQTITRQIEELLRIREEAENVVAFLIESLDEAEGDADEEPSLGWALPWEWGQQLGRRFLGAREDLEEEHDGLEDAGDDEPSLAACNVIPGRILVEGHTPWPGQYPVVDAGIDQTGWLSTDDLDMERDDSDAEDNGDAEDGPDDHGIADKDAMGDPDGFAPECARLAWDGSGRRIARRMLAAR